jgi:hypothetical protein
MSWQDRSFEHADEAISYQFIQWVNNGDSLEPRSDKGGFACPVDQDIPIPGKAARIHHRGGSTTDVIFIQELSVAILRTRFAWVEMSIHQGCFGGPESVRRLLRFPAE